MLTELMRLVSFAALLVLVVLWSYAPRLDCKRYWAAGFCALAILFNPFLAVMTPAGKLSLLVVLAAVVPFSVFLAVLKTQPLLSIPSIADRTPGESL